MEINDISTCAARPTSILQNIARGWLHLGIQTVYNLDYVSTMTYHSKHLLNICYELDTNQVLDSPVISVPLSSVLASLSILFNFSFSTLIMSMGFSRQKHWSGLPFLSPGDLPDPRDWTQVSCIAVRFLPSEPPGKPILITCCCQMGGQLLPRCSKAWLFHLHECSPSISLFAYWCIILERLPDILFKEINDPYECILCTIYSPLEFCLHITLHCSVTYMLSPEIGRVVVFYWKHFLLQGIFPTQGSNPHLLHLLHWQVDFLPLCHLGSPCIHYYVEGNGKPLQYSCLENPSDGGA